METEQTVTETDPTAKSWCLLHRKRDHLINDVGLTGYLFNYLEKSKAIPLSLVPPMFLHQRKFQIKGTYKKNTK